jgi:hypothetical protein
VSEDRRERMERLLAAIQFALPLVRTKETMAARSSMYCTSKASSDRAWEAAAIARNHAAALDRLAMNIENQLKASEGSANAPE